MTPEARAWIADLAAQIVRRASGGLRLLTQAQVLEELREAVLAGVGAGLSESAATAAQAGDAGEIREAKEDEEDAGAEAQSPQAAAGREQLAALDRQELSALLVGVVPGILPEILEQRPDLSSFEGTSGQTLHHAPEILSRTYARILDRKGSPLLLMAEEIRANSRDYPRPVPVELFESPPFDLTPEEIEQTLRAMATDPAYQDIAFTTTSSGAVHLFSTLHLERGYAVFLAQRAESWADNP